MTAFCLQCHLADRTGIYQGVVGVIVILCCQSQSQSVIITRLLTIYIVDFEKSSRVDDTEIKTAKSTMVGLQKSQMVTSKINIDTDTFVNPIDLFIH
jgi:hypothetical protein